MSSRVAVFGNYGVGNLGDELMLQCTMELVRSRGAEPVVFCGRPVVIREKYGVEAHHFLPAGVRSFMGQYLSPKRYRQVRDSWNALDSVDAVVFGGGGLFVDIRSKAIFLWARQLKAALDLGKKVFLISQNVSLTKAYSRRLVIPLLKQVEQLTVRDRASLELLERADTPAVLSPDLTFLKPLVAFNDSPSERPLIAVALCSGGMGAHQYSIFSEFLKELQDRYDLELLVFQSDHDDDRQVYERLGIDAPVILGEEVFSSLSKASFVLGMRYHSLVFALQAAVPFLAFDYQPKVSGFVRDNALDRWLVGLDQLDLGDLQRRFDDLRQESDELRGWMRQQARLLGADGEQYHRFLSF